MLAKTRIRIKIEGRGEVRYAATLSGFSPRSQRPRDSFDYPRVNQRGYFHDKLSIPGCAAGRL